MRISKLFLIGCALLGLVPLAMAADHVADEAAIRAHYTGLTHAMATRDAVAAMSDYAPDVLTFDLGPPLSVVGSAPALQNYRVSFQMTRGPWVADFSDVKVTVDTHYAFATAFLHLEWTMNDGTKNRLEGRITNVFEKRDGRWWVIHEHTSTPIDQATLRAVVDAPKVGKGSQWNSNWK